MKNTIILNNKDKVKEVIRFPILKFPLLKVEENDYSTNKIGKM